MKYLVYVLVSNNFKKSYVGSTDNFDRRLREHNTGRSFYTKRYAPWKLLYSEEYTSLAEARKRERYLKSVSGRKLVLKKLFSI